MAQQFSPEGHEPGIGDGPRARQIDARLVRDHPVLHHQHPVGELDRLLHVVGDQQDGALVQRPLTAFGGESMPLAVSGIAPVRCR